MTKKQTLNENLIGMAEYLMEKAEFLRGARKHDYLTRAKQVFERAGVK